MSMDIVNDFSFKVLNHICQERDYQGNVAFSGVSLYNLLAVINLGLRGTTGDEVSQFLGQNFTELHEEATCRHSSVKTALKELTRMLSEVSKSHNMLFHSVEIEAHFERISKEIFKLMLEEIDFSDSLKAIRIMNEWVEEKTEGMINDLFKEPPDPLTTLVFINTLYFQAPWRHPFEELYTEDDKFTDDQGHEFQVKMMSTDATFRLYKDLENHVDYLFVPFKGGNTYAVISRPHDGHSLESVMRNAQWHKLFQYFTLSTSQYVYLRLPKLKISTSLTLVNTLNHFGVKDVFTPSIANISGITPVPGHISDLFQVSTFIVDEVGVKAAAATTSRLVAEWMFEGTNFFANKPYMIQIYSLETNMILFSVAVTNPNLE
ncbi:Serpin B9 [Thelohanellus kitauei]|uniref:Serpin B9 n=1 Tax=Thelohanellus kitauei TaxID=669202 RepID=A0A0C2JS78_THEKT|nr:Serpin B9 [Thelohanellus kitauei]